MTITLEDENNFGRCRECHKMCYCPDPSSYMVPALDTNGNETGYGCVDCTNKYRNEHPNVDLRQVFYQDK